MRILLGVAVSWCGIVGGATFATHFIGEDTWLTCLRRSAIGVTVFGLAFFYSHGRRCDRGQQVKRILL